MNARFFLLPVVLLALSVAGCDAITTPEAPGLQASPTATEAHLGGGSISGATQVAYSCSSYYVYQNDEDLASGSFVITSGGSLATVSNTSPYHATLWAGSTLGNVTLAFKDTGGTTLASTTVLIRPTGHCGPE